MTETKKVAPKKVHKASEGHVIVEVMAPHWGMTRNLKKGDIIEIPDRVAKDSSRAIRKGLYKPYTKGDRKPMHR